MTAYVGSGPYCYANALCTVLDQGWSPGLVETLTGSPFGFQRVGPMPLFDPIGWDPDLGLDQALELLGWACDRETFPDSDEAFDRLARLAASSPVFVGPLELGLLAHQPGADRPQGADHFVVVLDAGPEGVTMHDPQGHPYAWLPREAFVAAWGSETLGYGEGRFPLRTAFRQTRRRDLDAAVADLLAPARRWAGPPAGSATALRALAADAETGLGEPGLGVLSQFSLRLGARRRLDAAGVLARWPVVAEVLDRQARTLGRAQLAAVTSNGAALARTFREAADQHEEMVSALDAVGRRRQDA